MANNENTKVISLRVPTDVAYTLDRNAKKVGLNRSQYIASNLIDREVVRANSESNQLNLSSEKYTPDPFLKDILATSGATLAGMATFRWVSNYIDGIVDEQGNQRYTPQQTEFAAIVAALGVAVAGSKLIRDL